MTYILSPKIIHRGLGPFLEGLEKFLQSESHSISGLYKCMQVIKGKKPQNISTLASANCNPAHEINNEELR